MHAFRLHLACNSADSRLSSFLLPRLHFLILLLSTMFFYGYAGGCEPEGYVPEDTENSPEVFEGSRLGITRISVDGNETSLYHLWYLTNGGELYIYKGGYLNVFGKEYPSFDNAVSDRGSFVTKFKPNSLATVTRIHDDYLGYEGLHEFGYMVGEDNKLYELSFNNDLLTNIWRWGVNITDDEPVYNASGPIAANAIVDGSGNKINLVIYLDQNGNLYGCKSILFDIMGVYGPDYLYRYSFDCERVDLDNPLSTTSDLVRVNNSDEANPTFAYFLGKSIVGRLVLIQYLGGSGWNTIEYDTSPYTIGDGLTGVLLNYDVEFEKIIVHTTDRRSATDARLMRIEIESPYTPPPMPSFISFPLFGGDFVSLKKGEIDSKEIKNYNGFGDDKLIVSGITNFAYPPSESQALWTQSYIINRATATLLREMEVSLGSPSDVRTLIGGVLVEDFPHCIDPPSPFMDCSAMTERIFSNGSIGFFHGNVYVAENTVDPYWPVPTDSPTRWMNLGTGHTSVKEASTYHKPHNELFLAEYDGNLDEYRGIIAAASIVRESPFHVFMSYSVNDGMDWIEYDSALPFIDPGEGIDWGVGDRLRFAQFQTDPTIAFDYLGRGYIVVCGGILDEDISDPSDPESICIPGEIDRMGASWYIDTRGIYLYRFTYEQTGWKIDTTTSPMTVIPTYGITTEGPFWIENERFVRTEDWDHSWIVARHGITVDKTIFYTTYMIVSGQWVYLSYFTDDDVSLTAANDRIHMIDLNRHQVKYIDEDGSPKALTGAPIIVMDSHKNLIINTYDHDLCYIDTSATPSPGAFWYCTDRIDIRGEVIGSTGMHSDAIFFEYSDGIVGVADCGSVKVRQPTAVATSKVESDRLFFVYTKKVIDCGYENPEWLRVYMLIGEKTPTGWDFGSPITPIQISEGALYGDCAYDFDPEITVLEDDTLIIWWRTIAGQYKEELSCGYDGMVEPITFQQAAVIRPELHSVDGVEYDFAKKEIISISNEYGKVENLPVHCGRGSIYAPEHFFGEYDVYTGGNTHAHIPFTVPDETGGFFNSQMMHSIVTPYNY